MNGNFAFGEPIDVTGEKYGKLTAIKRLNKNNHNSYTWLWKCDCGNLKEAPVNQVKYGNISSCGCAKKGHSTPRKQRNLVGQKYGKLLVLKPLGKINGDAHFYSLVRCDCGEEFSVKDTLLINKRICGCRHCGNKTHGMTNTRLFTVWQSMIARCSNPNEKSFKNYGARGISVCSEWQKDFNSFYQWAIKNGYGENLQIDRINVYGNYDPDNCRWVTQRDNARNRRNTIFVNYEGELLPIGEIAERTGILSTTIYERLYKYGWDEFDATHIPPDTKKYTSKAMRRTYLTNTNTNEVKEFQSSAAASRYLNKLSGYLISKSYKHGNVFREGDWLVEILNGCLKRQIGEANETFNSNGV